MNPLTVTLEHRYLQAAATFASIDTSRFVLNGVLLQVLSGTSSRNIILTATDGRRLISLRFTGDTSGFEEPTYAIIPTGICKARIGTKAPPTRRSSKSKRSANSLDSKAILTISDDPRPKHPRRISISNIYQTSILTMPEINGTFPNFPAVFPKEPAVPAVRPCIGFEYYGDIARVAKLLGGRTTGGTLYQYPNAGAYHILAEWGDDADVAILVMPMRSHADALPSFTAPDWVRTFLPHSPKPPAPPSHHPSHPSHPSHQPNPQPPEIRAGGECLIPHSSFLISFSP
jgi:hypothetical protein